MEVCRTGTPRSRTYAARVAARVGERPGLGDALGVREEPELAGGSVSYLVLGEAPDLSAASAAANQHAAEVLDGYTYRVDVSDLPQLDARMPRHQTGAFGANQSDRDDDAVKRLRAARSGQSGRMFSACGPFGPWVTSNSTFWFSSSER